MKTSNLSLIIGCAIALLFSSCSKDPVDYSGYLGTGGNTGGNGGGGTAAGTYYFKATINGKAVDLEVTDTPTGYAEGTANGNTPADPVVGPLTAFIASLDTNKKQSFGAIIGTFNTPLSSESAYFNNFVTIGAWNYDPDITIKPNSKQMDLYYNDEQGNEYDTYGDQTGSTLNVISVTKLPAADGWNQSLKIKITFDCKMYPSFGSTGDPIVVTNGEAVIRLEDELKQ